eukprot:115420_1
MSQEFNATQEATSAFPTLVLAVTSLVICFTHLWKFYQDFFTTERKCLDHRRQKPVLDWAYRKGSYLTLATLLFYTTNLVITAFIFSTSTICSVVPTIVGAFAVFGAKGGLYCTYIFRLHQVFGPCAYGFSHKKLVCIAISVIVVCVACFVATMLAFLSSDVIIHSDTDDQFPHHCSIEMGKTATTFVGGVVILFEISASALAIWGFTRPLNKVVRAVEQTLSSKNVLDDQKSAAQQRNEKILYSGYKYKVLVICASLTTYFYIVLFLAGFFTLGGIFYLVDYVINPVCLLLMTPYYPSNLYYERLCYLCICCCDRRKKSYQSKASVPPPRASVTAKSVDTSRAARESVKSAVSPSQSPPDDAQSDVQLAVDLNTQTDAVDADETGVTPEPPNNDDTVSP